ncbi:hypothetical protein [Amycolatopsis alkalitolerans]|nr:hypothetical protein [Amycolatopsis alkalitolerans]
MMVLLNAFVQFALLGMLAVNAIGVAGVARVTSPSAISLTFLPVT